MTLTPFMQGSQAFMNEASTSSCSFAQGSSMQREWVQGWSDRQLRERAHRSRAIGETMAPDLRDDLSSVGPLVPFRPTGKLA